MLHCDRYSQDINKKIGDNISMLYSLSYLIPISILLTKWVSILVFYWKSTSYLHKKNPSQI